MLLFAPRRISVVVVHSCRAGLQRVPEQRSRPHRASATIDPRVMRRIALGLRRLGRAFRSSRFGEED